MSSFDTVYYFFSNDLEMKKNLKQLEIIYSSKLISQQQLVLNHSLIYREIDLLKARKAQMEERSFNTV